MKNKKIIILSVVITLGILFLTGCNYARKWAKEEQMAIENYLGSIGDTTYIKKPSGLYYLDLVVGTGDTPVTNDTAAIYYKGKFLDGSIFMINLADTVPLKFIVGKKALIEGIEEGVTYMKSGGKANLLIPSDLGYGSYGYYTVPGYTPLLYEITLVQVNKHGSK